MTCCSFFFWVYTHHTFDCQYHAGKVWTSGLLYYCTCKLKMNWLFFQKRKIYSHFILRWLSFLLPLIRRCDPCVLSVHGGGTPTGCFAVRGAHLDGASSCICHHHPHAVVALLRPPVVSPHSLRLQPPEQCLRPAQQQQPSQCRLLLPSADHVFTHWSRRPTGSQGQLQGLHLPPTDPVQPNRPRRRGRKPRHPDQQPRSHRH